MDNVTADGYRLCKVAMQAKKLSGEPVTDAKTYQAWKQEGFQVRKGQKAFHKSVTYIPFKDKKTGTEKTFPKVYSLFHRSQVDAMRV